MLEQCPSSSPSPSPSTSPAAESIRFDPTLLLVVKSRSTGEASPSGIEYPRRALSRERCGGLLATRSARPIYVPDPEPGSLFLITAYDLRGKPLTAYRRRRRKNKP
jgi:hypothetical protein